MAWVLKEFWNTTDFQAASLFVHVYARSRAKSDLAFKEH